MSIRPIYIRKNGKRHAYWALVESYRTERGSPGRHHLHCFSMLMTGNKPPYRHKTRRHKSQIHQVL